MQHLANSMANLCNGGEQDNAGWEGVPIYGCSEEEAVSIIAGRGGDLFICQRVNELRLHWIRCLVCICRDSNKVIGDLIHLDNPTISASLV